VGCAVHFGGVRVDAFGHDPLELRADGVVLAGDDVACSPQTIRDDVMAAAQRPAALSTLGEPSGPPAWKTIPSWYEEP
jgi:hypothetical protein